MSASLQLPGGLKTLNPQPEIARYYNVAGSVYITTAQVLSEIVPAARYVGQTFLVVNTEYWFMPTTADADLVKKTELTSVLTQTITDGDTTHAPSSDAVYDALLLKGDKSVLDAHIANVSNPHNVTAIQVSATPHVDYLTGANVQLQLDQTENSIVGLVKTDKTNFKDIYQTGRARIDTDTSVLSISPADTLNISAVDNILFINEIAIDTPANKTANYLLSFGNRTFVANATNTLLAANTRGIFYIGVDKLGNSAYRTSKVYDQDICYLARIIVANAAGVYSIISFKYFPDLANNRVNNHDRLILSSGYIVPSGAASISFGNRAVTFSKNSINYSISKFDPNYLSVADTVNPTPMQFLFALPNLSSLAVNIALSTIINPTQWYNAGGTVGAGAVAGANYQVYKLLVSVTGTLIVQTKASTSNAPAFGINAIFANRDDALAGLSSVVFPEILPLGDAVGLGTFYLRAGTAVNGSQLNDPNDFYFRPFTASSSSSSIGVTVHDLLSGKNDNPAFQHVTTGDIGNWNGKANDTDVVHKAGAETLTGKKTWTLPIDQGAILIDMPPSANSSPDSIVFKIRGSNNPAGGFTTSTFTEVYNTRNVAHWVTPQVGAEWNIGYLFKKLDGVSNNTAFEVSNELETTFKVDDLGNLTAQNGLFNGNFQVKGYATISTPALTSNSLTVLNTSYSSVDTSGTVSIGLGFANHGGAKIEGYKQYLNTTGLKFYGEKGFNVPLLLMTLDANNERVGIGTDSPQYKLDVQGDIAIPYGAAIRVKNTYDKLIETGYNGSADFVNIYTAGAGANNSTPKITILDNGAVGIGTTNPTQKIMLGSVAQEAVGYGFNTPTSNWGVITSHLQFQSQDSVNGDTNFSINLWKGTAGVGYGGTYSKLFINGNNGRVGIGTTSPSETLTINTSVYDDGIGFHYADGIGYSKIGLQFDTTADTGNKMQFSIGNAAGTPAIVMTLLGDGNVDIGGYNVTAKLGVNGTVWSKGILLGHTGEISDVSTANVGQTLQLGGTDAITFRTYTSGWDERMRITNNGFIGINTSIQYRGEKLGIGGKIYLTNGFNSDIGSGIYGYNDNSLYNFEGGFKLETYKFGGSGYGMATAVIVSGQGNVGIGGAHPQKKLQVNTLHDYNQDDEIRIGSFSGAFYGMALNYRIDGVGSPISYLVAYDGGVRYNTIRLAGNDIYVAGNTQSVTFNGVRRYKATLSQAGTTAPTVNNIFENTLGNIVWSYDNIGRYIGTLAGAFVGKINIELSNNLVYTETGAVYTYCLRQDNNTIILISLRNNNPVNDYLNNIVVTIEKYP